MRNSKKWWFLAVLVLLLAFLFLFREQPDRERILPDGSILRLEQVTYGRQHDFKPGGWRRQLREHLPDWLAKHLGPAYTSMSSWAKGNMNLADTNRPDLYIWFTRRDPNSGANLPVQLFAEQILDEHGCPFTMAMDGGSSFGGATPASLPIETGWCAFQAFPRHEKKFHLRLYDNQYNFLAEFIVPNPAPPPKPRTDWSVQPLPIVKQDGEVAFTLSQIKIKDHGGRAQTNRLDFNTLPEILPAFQVTEHGEPTTEWAAVDKDWSDASGNFASKWQPQFAWLCPKEAAWKLTAKFCGSESSRYASNSCCVVHGLVVPAPGQFVSLGATQLLQGVTLEAVAMAGAGDITYSNNVLTRAIATSNAPGSFSMSTSGQYSRPPGGWFKLYKLQTSAPHVALRLSHMTDNQRLTLRATDNLGRNLYAEQSLGRPTNPVKRADIPYIVGGYNNDQLQFLFFDLPDDAKTLDLTFCIHHARTAEFIFKPPAAESK
jgi:hypothetical protein